METQADLRRFIVLSGEQEWGVLAAKQLIKNITERPPENTPEYKVLYFGQTKESGFSKTTHSINQVLGREHTVVIFDAFSGFNPDAFAAIAGTITAGGSLILLCPQLEQWHQFNDPFSQRMISWPFTQQDSSGRFIKRFVKKLINTSFIDIITNESSKVQALTPPINHLKSASFITEDQQQLITSACKLIESKQAYPLIIEADRGRGKSAALGIAAAKLMSKSNIQILVTAPTLKTSDIIFKHAKKNLSNIICSQKGELTTEKATLSFIAPDACCQNHPPADVLIIDEAASLPTPILSQLLKHYPRIIFASTVHGYEGTGRGFALRFKKHLDIHTPEWKKLTLQTAIRYKANDPLETFLFNSLLLKTNSINEPSIELLEPSACSLYKLDRNELLNNEALLQQIFGLLVLAHYQTRPSDLYHLLDGMNVSIYLATYKGHVVATTLTVREGGFDAELAHDIHYGKRRPQGNLVPQSLAVHAGLADAPLLVTERIMRIVVHPAVQKRGLASMLLEYIESDSKETDSISSSFAATAEMVNFWKHRGFKPVHIGLRRDTSSGSHSLIVIKPLSKKGQALTNIAQQQLALHLPSLLEEPLKDIEIDIVTNLQIREANQCQQLSLIDIQDLESFAYGHRGYDFCSYAIQKLIISQPIKTLVIPSLGKKDQQLLQHKVTDKQPIDYVVALLRLTGKKELIKLMRLIIQQILIHPQTKRDVFNI